MKLFLIFFFVFAVSCGKDTSKEVDRTLSNKFDVTQFILSNVPDLPPMFQMILANVMVMSHGTEVFVKHVKNCHAKPASRQYNPNVIPQDF